MTKESQILQITAGKSDLAKLIPQGMAVHKSALVGRSDFESLPKKIDLILLDTEREPGIINLLPALLDYSPLHNIPIWGCLNNKNIKVANLFRLFGGTDLFTEEELRPALEKYSAGEKPASREEDAVIPRLTKRANGNRLADKLSLVSEEQAFNTLHLDSDAYTLAMKRNLDALFTLISPHIAIILINDNQQATGFIRPSPEIFEQDYKDFMNFCLNDFFNHFHSLNLEDIKETFFLGGREDFSKINMNRQKLSSYIYFPLLNNKGEAEATIHLGHLRNNYFSDRIVLKIKNYIEAMNANFFLALRNYQIERRQEKILNIFKRFVPAEIIPELIQKEHNKEQEEVKKSVITILFSDIRSFTTITEQNSAQGVVDFLNTHFDAMVSIIKKYGGTIDKFIGDAIVAMFGVPHSFEDNSLRAVKAAVEMIERLETVDCSGINLKDDRYRIGVGIHQGPAIIGNVGSEDKADYTAIGSVIGIAEELEAMTKNYGTPILVSEAAKEAIGEALPLKETDTISLAGEMKIYSPVFEAGHE